LRAPYDRSQALDSKSPRDRGEHLQYRVSMEPIGTNVFFLAGRPLELSGDYGAISMDYNGSIFNNGARGVITNFEALSELPIATAGQLQAAGREYPTAVTLNYLQLPNLDPRATPLARRVTASAGSDYDRAVAVERYLQSNFGYTFDLGNRTPAD